MATVVYTVGDDVSTDLIYPGRYMATVLPTETPQYAFADDLAFNRRLNAKEVPLGGVVVAGRNFGCGSSREQAVSCLSGHGLVIVAQGFARIFMHNAINLGLRVVVCPTIQAALGDQLEVTGDQVLNRTSGQRFPVEPMPAARQAIMEAGGLISYTRKRLLAASTSPTP
jgi:3-isopropylmalate/(R)-2-methylmalate dehydratase small subunit